MTARIHCKVCKETLLVPPPYKSKICKCGKLEIRGLFRDNFAVNGEDYCMVDDKGNEIIFKDEVAARPSAIEDSPPETAQLTEEGVYKELMGGLSYQIEAMESLSSAGKFSPCVNQDLLAHLVWVHSIFGVLDRRLKSLALRVQALEPLSMREADSP